MKRHLIKTLDNGDMLVLDEYRDGVFQGGILTTELRPTTIYTRIGGLGTRAEATAALSSDHREKREG